MQAVDEGGDVINMLHYPQVSLKDLLCFRSLVSPPSSSDVGPGCVGGSRSSIPLVAGPSAVDQVGCTGPVLHMDETWAAARYHPAAKNRAQAPRFGQELEILKWAEAELSVAPALQTVRGRMLGLPRRCPLSPGCGQASRPRLVALVRHPGTALVRLNILGSAVLGIFGLGAIRKRCSEERFQR